MKLILGISLLLFAFTVNADTLSSPKKTNDLCKKSVTYLSQGKASKTFEILKPYWPMPAAELDNLTYQTKTQLNMVAGRFGNPIGYDFIRTEKAGNSFLKHTYIVKYEKHALRYMCIFYKPDNSWIVNSVVWDDSTPLLFQ